MSFNARFSYTLSYIYGGFFRDVGSQRARNKMSALDNGNLQFNFINYFLQFVDIFVLCQWLTPCLFLWVWRAGVLQTTKFQT